jgi:ribosomal protein S18 acetylase RimI-like enzyme
MNKYLEITLKDWEEYGKAIIFLEKEYPALIASDADDMREKIGRDGAIALLHLYRGNVAGFAIGFPLSAEECGDYHLEEFWTKKSIYLESITVSPDFQKRGFGRALMIEFMRHSRENGYARMIGHFRPNGSAAIMRKLNAEQLSVEKDWFGTGQDYVCYAIALG